MGDGDQAAAATAARPGGAAFSAVLAGTSSVVMAAVTAALLPTALDGFGENALIAWVLVAAAGLGTVLCLYLTVIWALAAMILVAGPASLIGSALLAALKVLAPQVARRIAVGVAVATTATGLVLVPATAASSGHESQDGAERSPLAVTSELNPSAPQESDPDAEAPAPTSTAQDRDDTGSTEPLPPLGWGESPGSEPLEGVPDAQDTEHSRDQNRTAPESTPPNQVVPATAPDDPAAASGAPSTVVVRPGDTLWSITDDLLGPAPENTSEIAAAWPLLHQANIDEIGTDPDILHSGQELSVPASLTSQEQP